jgi:YidC/Oxa1 family membrane protein insertase
VELPRQLARIPPDRGRRPFLVLVDALGSIPSLISLTADQISRTASTLAPGIIIWDQYVDLVEWVLSGLGNLLNSGGLAIIVFTIIVKTLLLPLTIKSIRSSKAMQELAPKIKEIQKKYGQDRQKASQETFALYSQHGVNPMAGCLPMLIQMPIFFGVYFGIREMSGSGATEWANGFLWLDSLKQADPWHVLPILAGFFQFIQTRMMRPANQKITDPQQQIMNTMMTFMPLTVVLFGWGFDSGPVLYWVVQAIYSVVQQWLITGWGSIGEWFPWLPELPEHRRLGYAAPRDINDVIVVSGAGAPERKGIQGWLHKRMEEAQKNAAERQAELKKRGAATAQTSPPADGATEDDARTTKPSRKSTSYQSRVDAATKFGNKNGQAAGDAGATTEQQSSTARRTSSPTVNRPRPKKKKRAS